MASSEIITDLQKVQYVPTPVRMRIFDQVREPALNWDGRDPIRMNWPQGKRGLRLRRLFYSGLRTANRHLLPREGPRVRILLAPALSQPRTGHTASGTRISAN